jgi:ABC-2 type transport system permease protein
MSIYMAMVKKDLKLLFRDKVTVFFTFGFPLIFAAFFGSIMSFGGGGSSGMSVAVADLDQSPESAAFVQKMDEISELKVELLSEFEAREATRKGKKVAYIILPEGFGAAYGSLFTGGTPQVIIGVDPVRKAEAGMLEGVMMKLGVERFSDALGDSGQLASQLDASIEAVAADDEIPAEWKSLLSEYLPQIKTLTEQEGLGFSGSDSEAAGEDGEGSGLAAALTPLELDFEDVTVQREGPKNGYAVTIPQAMYWAMMGVVMGFGVALVQEKNWGTMTRLVTAPLTRAQILGGKAAGCFFALLIVMTVLFVFARLVFNISIDYPLKVALALVCVSSGFVGLMMFLAALGKTEKGMASLGWGVMMVFAMFGGAMIPLFAMPDWMKSVSHFSPVKWAILSFEGATWRGFSYAELALPLSIMLIMGIVLFFAGSRMLRLED